MVQDNEKQPGFAFKKLPDGENYKEWARQIRYYLESTGLWDYLLSIFTNLKQAPIVLSKKNLKGNVKLERQKKCVNKITA